MDRVAGAPISWGVCEVPDWGYQLPAATVLTGMRGLGLSATELGPDGFLPDEPGEKAAALQAAGLAAVGGFVPVVLHDEALDAVAQVKPAVEALAASGAGVVVLAAVTGETGYDSRPALDDDGWSTLTTNLDRVREYVADCGMHATLHPHVGTMVERPDEVERVLDRSTISLCLDTGHLLIGGTDPVELARQHSGRVAHVHLKDVDASVARRVAVGQTTYAEAVAAGLYRPLGQGDVDVARIVRVLEDAGYAGWYVLEQDRVLERPASAGAASDEQPLADVRASIDFLRALA